MATKQEAKNRVSDHYESEFSRVYEQISGGHIHLGIWDDQNPEGTFDEATLRLTRIAIGKTRIGKGEHFCDFGCGLGVPAILLAREKGCRVTGVTLSRHQKEEAEKRAAEQNVSGLTRFRVADALDQPFEDGSFDGGWFLESIFHMGHAPALKEAARLLKPGAVLVITDVTDQGKMTEEQKQHSIEQFNAAFIRKEAYPDLLRENGFEPMELLDVSEQVMGPFEEKLAQAVETHRKTLETFASPDLLDYFPAMAQGMNGVNGYVIVTAVRK